MKDFLDKLSSYNLFNYLLPGTLFIAAAQRISTHTFKEGNIVIQLFEYYFIGLVISRLGSLILEPAARWTRFVRFAAYADFMQACRTDSKIETLSEQNNMFRTLAAVFLAVFGLKVFDSAIMWFAIPRAVAISMLCGVLFLLFLFAYRKQTGYVAKRVEANVERRIVGR